MSRGSKLLTSLNESGLIKGTESRVQVCDTYIVGTNSFWSFKKKSSRAEEILDEVVSVGPGTAGSGEPISSNGIKRAFTKRLSDFGFDGVSVESVEVDFEGNIIVDFEDTFGSEMSVLFQVSSDKDVVALVSDDNGESVEVDFSPLNPPIYNSQFGLYAGLTDLSWMNKSALSAILTAGDTDLYIKPNKKDPEGNTSLLNVTGNTVKSAFGESRSVMRGSRRIKAPIVRERKRYQLTSEQRQGMAKVESRRKSRPKSEKVRKKSLVLRKK